uniref:dihydrofolate reductase n=1 Tax=Lepisosteus oculatus TaxID=7918 RepID=W5NDT1_LEPOC|nr:PREDICTED: dihydrofolate reductase-like isoform X1 [Lepisosteus oculatus]
MSDCEGKVHRKSIRLIAAACNGMGIGKDGILPWSLPKEFKFFLDTITSVSSPDKKNLLIWGKRCWISFPESLHPLANCIHVVLSRTMGCVPDHAHYLCHDLPSVIQLGSTHPLSDKIETIWILGGAELYKESLKHPWCDYIYLTQVMADFDCDTFFPEFDREIYKLQDEFPGVPSEIQEDQGIKLKFQVFKKDMH